MVANDHAMLVNPLWIEVPCLREACLQERITKLNVAPCLNDSGDPDNFDAELDEVKAALNDHASTDKPAAEGCKGTVSAEESITPLGRTDDVAQRVLRLNTPVETALTPPMP
eukprot:CAMPEP_0204177726 /NCGR_PEP_ID=MMETSP0361-20130328/48720_1 /ASSEMBLY_ACC=CAM_ASM_000343 /TAXON_ID=268821 /ORGANISM="Scrippsiella Hangoei, Strain SHTV-5" /LENGTH=111 /DNA_ID=CAMNT_0051136757 /DNA_START=153 /DNA_END=484 /DNA_ORIENTATION=-